MRICECCKVDLRRPENSVLIFASGGDNITPPQQALGWVPVLGLTPESLIADGQRIVYLLSPRVGHLGLPD